MSKQLKYSLLLLVGAIGIGALMVWLRPEPETQERIEAVPLVETVAFEAASGPIPVIASGTVQPRDVVVIGAQVGGRLAYVHPQFREGGVVPAGATVLRIEPTDFQNQVRIAEADVAAQNVAVLQAQEEVAIAQDELARFAEREAAVAGLSSIDDNDYAARIMPPERLARSNAPASGQQASSSVLASREPQLRSARAARERASANLAVAQLSLSRTRVAAWRQVTVSQRPSSAR